jgi:DNA-binding PadR family transcriptional regulator
MSVRSGLLALLSSGPRHGYELKKELEERTGSLWELNVGQVYTTLSRLERDGLVQETSPGGARSGPQDQRQYELTAAGRHEVRAWFSEPRVRAAPDRDELVIKLTLAASLDDVDLDAVIDAQRVATTEELQRYTRLKATTDESDHPRLFALDAVIAQIDGELRWLDQCQQRHHAARRRSRRGHR